MGRPIYGYVCEGYWQDIGNLDQYRQANFDALDEKVNLTIPGVRLSGNVWIGEGIEIDDVAGVSGPAFIGDECRIASDAAVMPYTVLGSGVTLRERAHVARSVVDSGTYIGRGAHIEGAILGAHCQVQPNVRLHEGVAVGDHVVLGEQAVIYPGVRIYPYKEVDSGAHLHESLIWESRASPRLFSGSGITGLVNVDVTPETAVRLGAALGTALKRGSRVVATREGAPAYRMIKRSIISGLNSAGVSVADLQTLPAAVGKHCMNTQNYDAAFHVGTSGADTEVIRVSLCQTPARSRRVGSGSWSTTATRRPRPSCRHCWAHSESRRSRRIPSGPTPERF
jgi:mannose-1-phosphate guanylyltransferase/phosphomannomutase